MFWCCLAEEPGFLPRFKTQEIANLAWGFAHFDLQYPALLDAITELLLTPFRGRPTIGGSAHIDGLLAFGSTPRRPIVPCPVLACLSSSYFENFTHFFPFGDWMFLQLKKNCEHGFPASGRNCVIQLFCGLCVGGVLNFFLIFSPLAHAHALI